MKKIKKFKKDIGLNNKIDVKIEIQDSEITGFVINLRCLINGKWHEVYRVDTAHGYLHEQRHWISEKPIPIDQYTSLRNTIEYYINIIENNCERYKRYFIEKKIR
jgi:hypothetical protein